MVTNSLDKLLKDGTDNTSIQLFRYVFVGGVAFLVDFGSLYLLTEFFGIYYLTSAAIAFLLGLITNYILSISWVFNKRTLNNI
ncbi:MAG: GtrA family protein, partial [Methanobacteriaceae archaeon]|nr:GtrA family protein [Methanobacteriaceae archaeon]